MSPSNNTTQATRSAESHRHGASTTADTPPATPAVPPGDILIVDDDASTLRLIEAFVRQAGHHVRSANNGRDGLNAAIQQHPDLILLDREMPELDGIETCRRLRRDPRFDDVPVVFLTGLTASDEIVKGFAAGGIDYITKPVSRTELAARLNAHLELARARRKLRQQTRSLEEEVENQAGRLGQVRDGQTSILANPNDFPEINTAVRFQPTLEAGGDFYDILRFSDDAFGILVADVSGHDLGVAYLTGALKALTVSFTNDALSVRDTMIMLNAALRKFLSPGQYVTSAYAKYTKSRRLLEVTSAGHPPPLLIKANGEVEYITVVGDVLGMHEHVICDSADISVGPGDRLLLYTDGLTESYPEPCGKLGSRRFGAERLAEEVRRSRNLPLQEMVNLVVDDLIGERGGEIDDDVVLLGLEF